mgnify:CR=1 FL=1
MIRADLSLVERGLCNSRTLAKSLITQNYVEKQSPQGWICLEKPSELIDDDTPLRILPNPITKFVSRGGLKLDFAIREMGLEFQLKDLDALDIGVSTGGFTHCLLTKGIAKAWGVDVGEGQLSPMLKGDTRLNLFEKVNARDLSAISHEFPISGFDICAIDVSFISIKLILPEALKYLKSGGHLFALIKPQFEVGPKHLNKKGVVVDKKIHSSLCQNLLAWLSDYKIRNIKWLKIPFVGGDGNQEYIVYATKI